jgi:hypothetical protein
VAWGVIVARRSSIGIIMRVDASTGPRAEPVPFQSAIFSKSRPAPISKNRLNGRHLLFDFGVASGGGTEHSLNTPSLSSPGMINMRKKQRYGGLSPRHVRLIRDYLTKLYQGTQQQSTGGRCKPITTMSRSAAENSASSQGMSTGSAWCPALTFR